MYMTLEGVFGVPIDVSSTIIIMFCIFGAFLSVSGAGKFYVDFAFTAMGSKPTAAGRSVIATSYLLAMASGSGVANTVAIGSVAYPCFKRLVKTRIMQGFSCCRWDGGNYNANCHGSLGLSYCRSEEL
jgi:TRAP-type uncharacterized transport system fused permease subunit